MVAAWILAAILLASPLPFGSTAPWARLTLELGFAVCLLLIVPDWRQVSLDGSQRMAAALLLCGAAIGVIQIIPIPTSLASAISGKATEIRPTVAGVVEGLDPGLSTLALDPAVTLASVVWLLGLFGLGLAVSIVLARSGNRYLLAWVLVASAAFQSLYGAGELLSGRNQIFSFAKVYHLDSATGTFINRNHYAAYLAAILPFAMGLTIFHARTVVAGSGARLARLYRLALISLSAAAAAAIWIAILLSTSRAGLAVAALTTATFIALSSKRVKVGLLATSILALALLLVSLAEVRAPGERFAAPAEELSSLSGRLPTWRSAVPIAIEHPVLGVGLGNFDNVYRLYQPASVHRRWHHAHNEWLEWLIEGGIPLLAIAVGIAVTCGVVVARSGVACGRLSPWLIATSASLLGLATHAIVDFAPRIPAIATLAVVIVAFHLAEARVTKPRFEAVKPGVR
jgi:O-antigen ligase